MAGEPVVLLVPVLGRPRNVEPLLRSVQAATPPPYRVLFLPDPDDAEERRAIAACGAEELPADGGYASKINAGVRATSEPYVVLAADDVRPRYGWLTQAQAAVAGGAHVVGLNDSIVRPDRPEHATHFLLTREAAELPCLDGSPGPLYEGYNHWRVDDELIATARHRGHYCYVPTAMLEHVNHPMQGGADDATYQKGRQMARYDGRLFRHRLHLWA